MNQGQVEIIKQYLQIETNYAVLLNGEYGIGKTYFYKKYLVPQIEQIDLPKDASKKYIPIHISLFGLKNLDEIQSAIFLELYPILKNKNIKLATGIMKSIARGIVQFYGGKAGDIDNYLSDLKQDEKDYLKYDALVICFDDLDRKSEKLDLNDVFGFINSIVENQGAKVLIIQNEKPLLENDQYKSIREKVVQISIQYEPDVEAIFKQIVDEKYSSPFKEFLLKNETTISNAIKLNRNNFRNLIFFLEHFKLIFSAIENEFQTNPNFNVLRDEKLQAILEFTLAIAIEYKIGELNTSNVDMIKDISFDVFNLSGWVRTIEKQSSEKIEEKEVSQYPDEFRKKYFKGKKFYFFNSILEYIIGRRAFDVEELKTELANYFVAKDGKIIRQDEVLNQLSYLGCLNLDDEKYKMLTLEMLSFVDKGEYQLAQYTTIFHYTTRFNNLLGFSSLNKLVSRFKKGIKKGHYSYVSGLSFHLQVDSNTEFKKEIKQIAEFCLAVNESLKKNDEKTEAENAFKLLQTDFNEFERTTWNGRFHWAPLWTELEFKKVAKIIDKLSNEDIWHLARHFQSRYRQQIHDTLYPEKDFIVALKSHIDKPKKRQKRTLRNVALNRLSDVLSRSISNFPN